MSVARDEARLAAALLVELFLVLAEEEVPEVEASIAHTPVIAAPEPVAVVA